LKINILVLNIALVKNVVNKGKVWFES
jgi:hypothetical protein